MENKLSNEWLDIERNPMTKEEKLELEKLGMPTFWKLIENCDTIEMIEDLLIDLLSIEYAIYFETELQEKLDQLIQPKIAEVFLTTTIDKTRDFIYVSPHFFLGFRAWIVRQGQETYDLFLNFKSEKELEHLNLDINHAHSEELLYVVRDALVKKVGKEGFEQLEKECEALEYLSTYAKDIDLPAGAEDLEANYPILCAKYAST